MARLGDSVRIRTGKLDANASNENGQYPFFTCAIEPLKIDTYSYDCECVLVAGNGDLNVKYYNGKFDAYQRTYIIESLDKTVLSIPYLYCFLDKYVETLRQQAIGGVIKYIKLGNLTEAEIPIPLIAGQKKIVENLSKLNELIALRKEQLAKLDELVKSRFIELFGDPEYNEKQWAVLKLETLCSVSSSKRIYQNELSAEGVQFLRISDLVNRMDTGSTECELYIPEERYEELKVSGLVPVAGDMLLTARGTLGRCYTLTASDKFYFQDGMITWLYDFDKALTTNYLTHLFAMSGFRKQIDSLQAGSTVAYLSIAMTKKLDVMLPPIELQNQFATFVEQTDKSKLAIQQSLEKLETLKKALMQRYFG